MFSEGKRKELANEYEDFKEPTAEVSGFVFIAQCLL